MSFEEFMEDPYGDKTGGSYGEFTTIAKCKVVSAFQGWNDRQPKLFPYDGSKSGRNQAHGKCEDYCGEGQWPQMGILTIVYGDDIPTHPNGFMDNDWSDFVSAYHSLDKFSKDEIDEILANDDVGNDFPYDLVLAGVRENPAVFNTVQWCLLSRPKDIIKQHRNKKTTNGNPIRVYVVKEIFASREAAYKAAGVELTEENATNELDSFFSEQDKSDTEGLSAKAINPGGWTITKLKNNLDTINQLIDAAKKGDNPDSKHYTEAEAMAFACEQYAIEYDDLALIYQIVEDEVAF